METDILIIGGGLSGLALAARLEAEGKDWRLIEALPELGGRIRSPLIGGARFDLGPAWFWPGQPRMAELVRRLGLRVFEQYSQGAQVFQDRQGTVHVNRGYSAMQGSLRIAGGMAALISGLAEVLPGEKIQTKSPVMLLSRSNDRIRAEHAKGTVSARRVALTLPPRVAASMISFSPELPRGALNAALAVPTWMAGQAKIVSVYERPHWREAGLSGDAMSHHGPMVELHDASPAEGGPYAIFGFVGIPAEIRASQPQAVIEAATDQLTALFGAAMARPIAIEMMDWAQVPQVSTPRDFDAPAFHPGYGTPKALTGLWDGSLHFGSTETAAEFGGYLEGALEAAERVGSSLLG